MALFAWRDYLILEKNDIRNERVKYDYWFFSGSGNSSIKFRYHGSGLEEKYDIICGCLMIRHMK